MTKTYYIVTDAAGPMPQMYWTRLDEAMDACASMIAKRMCRIVRIFEESPTGPDKFVYGIQLDPKAGGAS